MNEEKKRILKLVEEGKITSAEALTLLELLEEEQKHKDTKEKELIHEVSAVVRLDEEEKQQKDDQQYRERKVASAKDFLFDLVDSVMTKVKDLDLNLTKNTEVTHIYQDLSADFTDINIEAANGSVEIYTWEEDSVKVEVDAKVYRTDQAEEARKLLDQEITLDIRNGRLQYLVGQKWMRVNSKIFIPKAEYGKVKISLFNGGISAEELTFDKLQAKTANGKIVLSKLNGQDLDAETANGNIEISDSTIGKIECETINGTVNSQAVFKEADMETFNGLIQVDSFNEQAKSLKAKSASGSIQITIPKGIYARGEVKANLGGLHLDAEGMKVTDEKKEVIQKFIKFDNENPESIYVSAESKTAAVTVLQEK